MSGLTAREVWTAVELIDLCGVAIKPRSFATLWMTARNKQKQIPRYARNDCFIFHSR
jgi:hypothetical protein